VNFRSLLERLDAVSEPRVVTRISSTVHTLFATLRIRKNLATVACRTVPYLVLLLQTLHRLKVRAKVRHGSDRSLLTDPQHLVLDVAVERVQQQRVFEVLAPNVARLRQRPEPKKGNVHLYSATNVAYSASAVQPSQTELAYSTGSSPSRRSRTLACSHTAVCRYNGLHLRNPCKYMDYYSFTDAGGMTHSGDYPQIGHLPRCRAGKGRSFGWCMIR